MNNKTNIEEDLKKVKHSLVHKYVMNDEDIDKMWNVVEELERLQSKANKYDSLVEEIKEIKEEVYTDEGIGFELDYDEKPGAIRILNKIQELLDTEK